MEKDRLEAELDAFQALYESAWQRRMNARLGLQSVLPEDRALLADLEALWVQQKVDHNRFLRQLSDWQPGDVQSTEELQRLTGQAPALTDWLQRYARRLEREAASVPIRQAQMRSVNPRYILRNYMAEEVIREAHQGDYRPLHALMPVLRHPGDEHPEMRAYAGEPPDWAQAICLTCSS